MPDFNETRLKGQDIRRANGKAMRIAFPIDPPFRLRSPTVPVNKEAEVRVAQQEFGLDTLDVDWLDELFAADEVVRRVGLVEQGLSLQGLQVDDFEALGTSNTQLRFEEMN